MSKSTSSGRSKRLSLPSTMPHPQPQYPPVMWHMPQMFNPYMAGGPSASHAPVGEVQKAATTATKPWELSTSESDEEMVQPVKKRKAPAPKKETLQPGKQEKRGPGRPSKSALEVANYPPEYDVSEDNVAYLQKDECPKCRIYKGRVAIRPCGHYKFCFRCINKLRQEAFKLKRPAKCLSRGCYTLVETWVKLFNVSG